MSSRRDLDRAEVAREIEHRARELADNDMDEEAAATYRVAADLREELGDKYYALTNRGAARRLLVTAWAQKRWPGQVTWPQVFALLPKGGRRDRENWTFRIRSLDPSDAYRIDVVVRIDSRDRIRVLRGGAE